MEGVAGRSELKWWWGVGGPARVKTERRAWKVRACGQIRVEVLCVCGGGCLPSVCVHMCKIAEGLLQATCLQGLECSQAEGAHSPCKKPEE
jgi:hypothetical protein